MESIFDQKYCVYIKDGRPISDVIECSAKDISLTDTAITIIRSSDPLVVQSILKRLKPPRMKPVNNTIIDQILECKSANDLEGAVKLINEHFDNPLGCNTCWTSVNKFLEPYEQTR